jgi:hypothetical protein
MAISSMKVPSRSVLDADLADFNRSVQEQGIPPVAALPKEEKK